MTKITREMRDIIAQNCDSIVKDLAKDVFSPFGYYSTNQVAETYGVSTKTINRIFELNKEEFNNDGIILAGSKDWKMRRPDLAFVSDKKKNTYFVFPEDKKFFVVAACPARWYTKSALVRIGLFLEESPVAKDVKKIGLNIYKLAKENETKAKSDAKKKFKLQKPQKETHIAEMSRMIMDIKNLQFQNKQLEIQIKEERGQLADMASKMSAVKAANKTLADEILKTYDSGAFVSLIKDMASGAKVSESELCDELLKNFFHTYKEANACT